MKGFKFLSVIVASLFICQAVVYGQTDTMPVSLNKLDGDAEACVPFSQLPGKHFCQAKMSMNGKDKYIVVRFELIDDIPVGHCGTAFKNQDFDFNTSEAVVYSSDQADGHYCKDDEFSPLNNWPAHSPNTTNIVSPTQGICGDDASVWSNTALFEKMPFTQPYVLSIEKKQTSNRCEMIGMDPNNGRDVGVLNIDGQWTSSDNIIENFIPGISIDSNTFHVDRLNEALERLENTNTTESRCIESDVIAAKEAALVLQHHKECATERIRVYRSRQSSAGDNEEVRDFRENEFISNQEAQFFTGIRGITGFQNRHNLSESPVRLKQGWCSTYFDKFKRVDRTVTDWLYGDGSDANIISEPHIRDHTGFTSNPHCMNE